MFEQFLLDEQFVRPQLFTNKTNNFWGIKNGFSVNILKKIVKI